MKPIRKDYSGTIGRAKRPWIWKTSPTTITAMALAWGSLDTGKKCRETKQRGPNEEEAMGAAAWS